MTDLIDLHHDTPLIGVSNTQYGSESMPDMHHKDDTQEFFGNSRGLDQGRISLKVSNCAGLDNAPPGLRENAGKAEEEVGYIEATYSFVCDTIDGAYNVLKSALSYATGSDVAKIALGYLIGTYTKNVIDRVVLARFQNSFTYLFTAYPIHTWILGTVRTTSSD